MTNDKCEFKPVFIVGCPRSGTTFLGYILGNHESILTTPQSNFLNEAYQNYGDRFNSKDLINFINNNWRFKAWKIEPVNICDSNTTYYEIMMEILKNFQKNNGNGKETIWLDHTPSNIKYIRFLLGSFPKAKFIHIIRDGRAIAASMKPLDWGANNAYVASRVWKEHILLGLSSEKYVDKKNYYTLHYEDLVVHTEKELSKIANFLNISDDFRLTNGDSIYLPEYTKNQHKLVGKKPNINRINSWKNVLSVNEIEVFEQGAGEILPLLGYDFVTNGKNIRLGLIRRMVYRFEDLLISKFVNRIKEKRRIKKAEKF